MSFLILGNKKNTVRPLCRGSEVQLKSFPPRSSLEAPRPYLKVKEFAVAPIDGLSGATGPRDPDDVDLQRGKEDTGVNTKVGGGCAFHLQNLRAKHRAQSHKDLGLNLSSSADRLCDLRQVTCSL